jgi:hypothetical protein
MSMTEKQLKERYDYDEKADTWYCKKCRSVIQGKMQTHPVWFKGMCCAGGGEVVESMAPYCPKCEKEPPSSGLPVYA